MIVGLSSHEPAQLDAALAATGGARPDYLSVGPVWETPTKAGRPRPASTTCATPPSATPDALLPPWFAIGAIDAANVAEVARGGRPTGSSSSARSATPTSRSKRAASCVPRIEGAATGEEALR